MSDTASWFQAIEEHFGRHHADAAAILAGQIEIINLLKELKGMSTTLQTDVTALTAAVGTLSTAITNEGSVITSAVADIAALVASGQIPPGVQASIEAATAAITTATGNIANAGSTLAAALPVSSPASSVSAAAAHP